MLGKFNRANRFALLAALCVCFVQYVSAQNPTASPQSAQQISVKVEEYMNAAAKVERFSGSILVARNGSPIASKGYGMANYELNVMNTPQTVFRLGSITKQFTAMAIMQLQERGKLNAGDSICKYLADCPAAWQPITIRNLLTHTGGVPNYTSFPDLMKAAALPLTTVELTGRFKDKPLEFTPGEKYAYSNSGYHLLGLIVERASGKSYADFLQENIFAPLGMKQTGYDDHRRVIKNRAAGYARGQGDSIVNAAYLDMSIPYAAGALYSTTEDLLVWEQALYTEKLASRKSLDEMFTPFKDEYGYGWGVAKRFDRQATAHGGGIFGFSTYIARFPADRVTVIVLSNNQDTPSGKIANDLSAIVFDAPYKIPQERKAVAVESPTLEKYVGQYQLTPNFIITVTVENAKLMAQATGQPKFELFAESEIKFFLKVVDAQVTFVKDDKGNITSLILHQGGRDSPAQKIK